MTTRIALWFALIFTLLPNTYAQDFIEAQMKLLVRDDGTKSFQALWDEENQTLRVEAELVWDNYEDELHARGFDLRETAHFNVIFPEPPHGCKSYKGSGFIAGAADLGNNRLLLEFKGAACKTLVPDFYLGLLVVHFYEVNSVLPGMPSTPVFRVQIWDHPHSKAIKL